MRNTGIDDLARHLGLTVGTVSRALNNRPEVNEKTRQRVMEAALEIGYMPNQSGRSLRTGTTSTIGFMLESGTANAIGSGDFFLQVVGGVQQVLLRHGLDLILLPCGPDEDPGDFLRRIILRRMVDGMMISATRRHDPRIELLSRSRVPFVTLGRSAGPTEHAWIDLDFEGVAADAVGRLVADGHRRIAVAIPDSDVNLGHVFRDAYRAALQDHGQIYDPSLVFEVPLSEAGGAMLAERIIAQAERPTSVILINELLAIGLYHRLGQDGLLPGRDIAVIGFRESPQVRFLSPHLSCYRLSLSDLGESLGEMLLSRMPGFKDAYPDAPSTRIWPMHFLKEESDRMEIART